MKTSISNLQIILLASVLSAALLFGVVFNFNGYHTQIAHAEQNTQGGGMSNNKGGADDDLISPITVWVGMAAIGMSAGLVISLRTKLIIIIIIIIIIIPQI